MDIEEHTEALKPHELEDGAAEVVVHRASRRMLQAVDTVKTARSPVGGKLKQYQQDNEADKDSFIAFRRPSGAAKVPLGHLEVLGILWRLWASKKASGEESGVRVVEIVPHQKKIIQSVRDVLNSLVKNGLIRSVRSNTGFGGNRVVYLPTDLGVQMLAIAQAFGPGTSIQIGGLPSQWKSRDNNAPESFFKHAALLKGRKS